MSQSPNQNQETEELRMFPETYEYFESSDKVTCNVGITFTLYSCVNPCLPLEPMQQYCQWSSVKAHICAQLTASFIDSAPTLTIYQQQRISSFFLEHKKEKVTHQFIAALCGMFCARKIYFYLQK